MLCESCFDEIEENDYGVLAPDDYSIVAEHFGADLPDHCCEALEDSDIDCVCSCKSEANINSFL